MRPVGVASNKSCSRRGICQRCLEVPDPGPQYGRAGHDDDVACHKTREERPKSLSESPTDSVPFDSASDTPAHSKTDAWVLGRLPGEMVQDEFGPGHATPLLHGCAETGACSEAMLPAQSCRLDGQAVPALHPPAADHCPAPGGPHALAKAVSALSAPVVRLESSLQIAVPRSVEPWIRRQPLPLKQFPRRNNAGYQTKPFFMYGGIDKARASGE